MLLTSKSIEVTTAGVGLVGVRPDLHFITSVHLAYWHLAYWGIYIFRTVYIFMTPK